MPPLRICHLTKTFSQGLVNVKILENATYTFDQGKTVALTGVSGSGKSTLLHMLAGLEVPSSGEVFFKDENIYLLDPRNRHLFLQKTIGFVFQSAYLIDELTVLENVMIKGLLANESFEQAGRAAYELLEAVGLAGKAKNGPRTLSGGEQQRVAVARALYGRPAFILADEPTAHLDAHTKKVVMNLLLAACWQGNTGLIIATHDESIADQMDTVLRLDQGRLIEQQKNETAAVNNHKRLFYANKAP